MKPLIVYYTRTGTTRKVAKKLSTLLRCDSEEIHETTSRSGIMGWLRAGRDSAYKRLTKLENVNNDPAMYDVIVIGTPIWNHTLSAPIRTYIARYRDRFKSVAFFCTGYTTDKNPIEEMASLCGKKPIATLRLQGKQEVEADRYQYKVQEFVDKIASQTMFV